MIHVRRAVPADAVAIAGVHVAAWRSTYPGLLPADYLARMSIVRQSAHYEAAIRADVGVFVALADDPNRIVGFASAVPARRTRLADGEVETLYVLDDYREKGTGRRLMARAAAHLSGLGCQSAFVWVLRDNPSRWFYVRLGGQERAHEPIRFAGTNLMQAAYVWSDITKLMSPITSP